MFGVDSRGSDGTNCLRMKAKSDTAEFTGMKTAELRK